MVAAAASSSFPRGKKPRPDAKAAAAGGKKRKHSASAQPVAKPGSAVVQEEEETHADALFGKRGMAATAAAAAEEQAKKPKKARVVADKSDKSESEPTAATAATVTFKALHKGVLLLGCVRQVTDGQDLMVSLPNKLNGTVSLAECSDEFFAYVQQQKQKAKAGKSEDEQDEELPALSSLFQVGQFVPCVVLGTSKESKRKLIHLSLRTSLLHAELSPSFLTKGTALHATVSSVEDHGAMVNLGIRGVHAFVPRKELSGPVQKGQHMLVNVLAMNTHTSTATVTPERSQVVKAVTRGDSFTIKQLVPGMLFNVRVEDVLANGLSVNFLTFFSATVEQNHMSLPCQQGWETAYRKGLKGRARIVSIDHISKQITLSMAPHVVHLQIPESPFAVGDVIEEASIERIDSGIGMLLSLQSNVSAETKGEDEDVDMEDADAKKKSSTNANWKSFAPAYVHISNVSDKHVDKLEKKFAVGASVKCRVIGFAPFDALVNVSCKESSLSQTVLRHKDLKVGAKVNGKILAIEKWGVLLEISEGVRALVSAQHVPPFLSLGKASKNKKAYSSGKYKVGKTVSARVLRVDMETKKTYLTMKKPLMTSELPILSSYEDATMGFITHGYITKIADYGVVVSFYDNVYGLVPMALLRQAGIENLEEAYVLGQVVKARITRCDVAKKRLMLSFDTTSSSSSGTPTAAPETASKLIGTTVSNVKVTDVEPTCFRVQTEDGVEGVIPFVQLTDFPRQTSLVDELVKRFSTGDVITEQLLVVSQASDGVLTLSKKPLLLEFASHSAILPRAFGDVKENAVLIGYVASVHATKGVFVKFLNNLVAVAPKGFLKEQFVSKVEDGMFEMGETVVCTVAKVDAEKKQFVVGFHQRNLLQQTEATRKHRPAFFQAYLREQASVLNAAAKKKAPFALGKTEKAEFVSVRPYGAVFTLEKDDETVTVIVPSVTEETNSWEEGDSVKVLLVDYDFSKGVYYGATDVSLVKSGSKKSRKQKQRLKTGGKIAAATVMAVSPTEKYAVVSFPDPENAELLQFGVVQLCDFWCPSQTSSQLGIEVGASVACRVLSPALKSANSFHTTPFDDLVLLSFEDEELLAKTKSKQSPQRKSDDGMSKLPTYSEDHLKLGNTVTGVIAGIKETSMKILLKTGKKGGKVKVSVSIVDVDEVEEASSHSHPFDRFTVKTPVTGRIIAAVAKGANKLKPVSDDNPATFHVLSLSLRAEDVASEKKDDIQRLVRPDWQEDSAGRALLKEGNSLEGVVTEQAIDSLTVKLSSSVTGHLSCVELSEDVAVVRDFLEKFPVGKRVKCSVLQVDSEKKLVDLSMIRATSTQGKAVIKRGSIVNGIISSKKSVIRPPSVMVQLGAHTFGRVCITEMLAPSQWKNSMLELPQFAVGKVVRCVVLSTSNNHIDLSLREDALSDPEAYIKATAKPLERNVGDLVPAIVAKTTTSGCFVRVDRDTTARVMLRDLSDDFVKDPQIQFPTGKLVAGRVMKKSDHGLELSLKASIVSEDVAMVKWSDVKVGLTVKGTITKVQTYGVFVKIEKSTISGLCHISEIADEKVTQPLDQIFSEGDYVKAKILKVEDRRVSFGLKPSYFEGEESSSEEEDDDEEEEEEEEEELAAAVEDEDDSEEEDDEPEAMDVDEEEVPTKKPASKKSKPVAMDVELDADDTSSEDEDMDGAAPVEFSWDGFANVLDKKSKGSNDADDVSSSSEDEDDDESEETAAKSSKKSRLQSDEWVALREKALASNDEAPQSASDYERLLAVSPQSSFLWIQYMAFHVSLTEVDLARDVAVRATSAVSFRDEKEKLNVWVAYLNLEHDFGDDASFLRVFKSALLVNHQKRVYLHLVDLYARAEEHEDVKQTLATMQKKFRTSKQAWIRALQYFVGANQFAEAAETLQRSLKSLAAHKHLPVILKYGQLLYEHSELDKARTIFEGILANYPKRMDLWNVYLDKEVKFGDVGLVRALFERLLAMEFSAKKMKFLFKKYLQFEQEQGDDDRVEHVKQLAKDFVASVAAK